MNSPVYLVDVSSMFFRAFYAIRQLSNSQGVPTNAVYGFLSMVTKLLREKKPGTIAFCLDSKEPSFRKDLDTNYKANRTEMPDDLATQIPYILRIADALGIAAIGHAGYEADDIIGTLTAMARKHGRDVVIVSGDKDFAQLVSPHVCMYDTMKEVTYDPNEVIKKWGVPPDKFRDYLAIVGDSSDNIAGVAGIGPKGAVKLLEEFGSLDDIYKNLDKISSKSVQDKLVASRDQVYLAQKLVTIVCDMPLNLTVEDIRLKMQNSKELHDLLNELEFKSFERMLAGLPNAPGSFSESGDGTAKDQADVDATTMSATPAKDKSIVESNVESTKSNNAVGAASDLSKTRSPRVDGLTEIECSLKEFASAVADNASVWLIPSGGSFAFGHENKIYRVSDDPRGWADELNRKAFRYSGFDLKSAWRTLHIKDPIAEFDAQLAIYVLRPQEVKDFFAEYTEFCGDELSPMSSAPEMYQGLLRLSETLFEKLPQIQAQSILDEIELPIATILYGMEECGVLIDCDALKTQSHELKGEIAELETDIYEQAGEVFNIGSPKQLSRILFEKLKLPVQKKTKTGYSTDNEVLETLARVHPICERLISYRELTKLKSTYVDALPALVNPETGRIHTTFNQALTATGRLSSSQPNLQNIPIRSPRGQRIRKAFVAPEGRLLISADYSQIELRILAHITQDDGLIRAFQDDLDIHQATASEIFGLKLNEVTPDLRRTAKAVNFGIAYGQGAFGLAQTLGIPRGEAQGIIERYFKRFKGIAVYIKQTIEQAKARGYVETLFGRRRYMPELKSSNQAIRKFGERAAINAPMQGTASDLVKMAMISVHNEAQLKKLHTRMILQVHDELVFEADTKHMDEIESIIGKCMTEVYPMRVPLKVNVAHGHNWDEAH